MRWYKHLYVGEKAKKRRFSMIQNIRRNKFQPGVHILLPASNEKNILDIYSATDLRIQRDMEDKNLLILGIAADYYEALEVARDIIDDMYKKTGGFSLQEFLTMNGQR